MSLFIKTFEFAHTDQSAGHVAKDKTIANIKRLGKILKTTPKFTNIETNIY